MARLPPRQTPRQLQRRRLQPQGRSPLASRGRLSIPTVLLGRSAIRPSTHEPRRHGVLSVRRPLACRRLACRRRISEGRPSTWAKAWAKAWTTIHLVSQARRLASAHLASQAGPLASRACRQASRVRRLDSQVCLHQADHPPTEGRQAGRHSTGRQGWCKRRSTRHRASGTVRPARPKLPAPLAHRRGRRRRRRPPLAGTRRLGRSALW